MREAYRDSVGVWTWGVGITDASGHRVERYRDNPQSLRRCLEVFCWALERRYVPPVLSAFGAHRPEEHEFGAALSFHWNTGAIARSDWMRRVRDGDMVAARAAIMNWCRPQAVTARRRREQVLFFDGTWSGDGSALVFEVSRPGYQPRGGRRVPIMEELHDLLEKNLTRELAATAAAPAQADAPDACAGGGNWFTRLFGR